ncbi:MAG: hypothetical protein IJ853_00285 [Rickettsiales bacterium]|nr:hypothetical protein [Rickettsiales bacterium]
MQNYNQKQVQSCVESPRILMDVAQDCSQQQVKSYAEFPPLQNATTTPQKFQVRTKKLIRERYMNSDTIEPQRQNIKTRRLIRNNNQKQSQLPTRTKLNTTNIQQYTIGTPQTSDSDVLSLPDDMVDKTFVNKTDKITNKMLNILAANIELTLQISKNNETNLKLLLQRQQNSRRMEQITQQHGNKSWRTIR